MKNGVIPNRFPDRGEQPEYNTADATLWMIRVAAGFGLEERFKEVIDCRRREVDPADHLLKNAAQQTWMDTKYTPRDGKCVEINALWHAALRQMGLHAEADELRSRFREKFWNAERNCLYDRIGDPKLRAQPDFRRKSRLGLAGEKATAGRSERGASRIADAGRPAHS